MIRIKRVGDMDYLLLSAPMSVNWNYTYKCNFNCVHCYSRTRTDIDELSTEDKLRVADNLARNKVFNVNLGGGEPILCDDCFEVIEYMVSRKVHVNLSTNGWRTSDETVSKLKKAGLKGVSVSIDHIRDEVHDNGRSCPGSLKEACKSIQKYAEAGIWVFLSTTITASNYAVLEDIIKLGVSLGAYGIDLKRLKTMGNAYKKNDLEITDVQRDELYHNIPIWKRTYPININLVYGTNRIKDIDAGCPCGKTSIAIMCNGDISPCVYNTFKIGNAVKDDLHEIWCNSESLKYLRAHFSCLGLAKEMTYLYRLKDNVVFQKDYRIDEDVSIADYARNPESDEIDPEDAIAVVAVDGTPYELNLTGAIILDEIIAGKSLKDIANIMSELFEISDERAASSVQSYADNLVELDVLEYVV